MANKKQFEINKEINKDNAKEKGYEWMIDMIYDPKKINEMVVEDFSRSVQEWLCLWYASQY